MKTYLRLLHFSATTQESPIPDPTRAPGAECEKLPDRKELSLVERERKRERERCERKTRGYEPFNHHAPMGHIGLCDRVADAQRAKLRTCSTSLKCLREAQNLLMSLITS